MVIFLLLFFCFFVAASHVVLDDPFSLLILVRYGGSAFRGKGRGSKQKGTMGMEDGLGGYPFGFVCGDWVERVFSANEVDMKE